MLEEIHFWIGFLAGIILSIAILSISFLYCSNVEDERKARELPQDEFKNNKKSGK